MGGTSHERDGYGKQMENVLLSEATTEQLYSALSGRLECFVFSGKKIAPSRDEDGEFFFGWKGDYLLKAGLVSCINSHLKYHESMIFKDRFEDDPQVYFDENPY